jgi:hypothetical protein
LTTPFRKFSFFVYGFLTSPDVSSEIEEVVVMKSRSIRVALLSTFALTSSLFALAGGQPAKVRMSTKDEAPNPAEVTRAVQQQGKGTGVLRNQAVVRANAWRLQTEESPAAREESRARHPNWGDSAFCK